MRSALFDFGSIASLFCLTFIIGCESGDTRRTVDPPESGVAKETMPPEVSTVSLSSAAQVKIPTQGTDQDVVENGKSSQVEIKLKREPRPIPEFASKALEWLLKAQHKDGGWGVG